MKLSNLDFINFCQNLLGAPYWFNASTIKATKNAYKVNSIRYPEEYNKRDISFYEQAIAEHEIVTDAIGLIKGFAWSDGGEAILANRGNPLVHNYKVGSNGCPDKTVNGMFVWATAQNIQWGNMETLPEVPGLIVTTHGRLGVYEGNGYVIEANKEAGYVTREHISKSPWRFWYQLPFIEYTEQIKIVDRLALPEEPAEVELVGVAIAIRDALSREGKKEDSKFLDIIHKGEKLQIFNDSDDKLIHFAKEEQEGYAISDLFIIFPEKPHTMSAEEPKEFNKKLKGTYTLIQNAGIRNKAMVRSNSYTVIPKGTEVTVTGGFTNNWYQVYAKYNNKIYVGYMDKQYLKKVVIIEK
jgi:hypothetical protein